MYECLVVSFRIVPIPRMFPVAVHSVIDKTNEREQNEVMIYGYKKVMVIIIVSMFLHRRRSAQE